MTILQPKTPPGVERIIVTALAKDPNKRWQDAGDLARELSWVITDSDTTTRNGTPIVQPPGWRLWLIAATAFIVWMLLPIVDDRLVRAEVGYLGATALLCAQLWRLHSVTRRPAPRARRASTPA